MERINKKEGRFNFHQVIFMIAFSLLKILVANLKRMNIITIITAIPPISVAMELKKKLNIPATIRKINGRTTRDPI